VLIAEGIETAAELKMLQELGVEEGQGFYLGRPAAI
jgi:EAL domain-containing protein (putative c-di-GMP-specific phosphodiesterase class I)